MGDSCSISLYKMYFKVVELIGKMEATINFYENDKDGILSLYGGVEERILSGYKESLEEAYEKKAEIVGLIKEWFEE